MVNFIEHHDSINPTMELLAFGTWTQLEENVGVWCACLPAFARLIKRVVGDKLSTYFSGRTTGSKRSRPSFSKSKDSHKVSISKSEADLRKFGNPAPPNGVSKTVVSRVVYDPRVESSDEVELMDRDSVITGLDYQRKVSYGRILPISETPDVVVRQQLTHILLRAVYWSMALSFWVMPTGRHTATVQGHVQQHDTS